jgi:hypothetical protein
MPKMNKERRGRKERIKKINMLNFLFFIDFDYLFIPTKTKKVIIEMKSTY